MTLSPRIHHFAAATAVATYLLLLVGGLVNPTGSSLACPDYPNCGAPLVGQALIEGSHRFFAMGVGVLTTILAYLLVRAKHALLGVVAFVAVCLQGFLGYWTVKHNLPPAVSISHLALSMAFFVLLVGLAAPRRVEVSASLFRWLVAAAALVYVQIVLGGVVRHTHAATVCGADLPLCFGSLWPAGVPLAEVHMAHRIFGVVSGLVAAGAGIAAARRLGGGLRFVALLLPALVLVQILLGMWTVLTWKGLLPVELHVGVGALLLGLLALLARSTRPAAVAEAAPRAAALVEQP
jgi:cytochrome c oxidase assembly protein subunit 15